MRALSSLVAVLLVLALAAPPPACGIERWPVKTMTDRARDSVDLAPVPASIDSLRQLHAPDVRHAADRAAPAEYRVFMVRAVVLGWKLESDADVHIVLASAADTTKTMIAEIPSLGCMRRAGSRLQAGAAQARRVATNQLGTPTAHFTRFRQHPVAIVTGVGFFDFIHGQTGVAPNGIELHPVLAIAFVSSGHRT